MIPKSGDRFSDKIIAQGQGNEWAER